MWPVNRQKEKELWSQLGFNYQLQDVALVVATVRPDELENTLKTSVLNTASWELICGV